MKIQAKQLRMLALSLCMTAGLILSGWWSVRSAFAETQILIRCNPDNGTPAESLARAIEQTNKIPGMDVIVFEDTRPNLCHILLSEALPTITDDLILRGDPDHVILDREVPTAFRILHSEANLTLENITVRDGHALGVGGGIYAEKALTLTDVNIVNNEAHVGAGVYAVGPVVMTRVRVSSNKSTQEGPGGGIYAGSTLTASAITVTHNTASNGTGGGIHVTGNAVISNSWFHANKSEMGNGGAIYAGADLQVVSSRFYTNTSRNAGGGVFVAKALTMDNSLLFGNRSSYGGGVYLDSHDTSSTIAHSHFEQNDGTGLYSDQPVIVNSSYFTRNIANSSSWGAGLFAIEATIDSSHFAGNHPGDKEFTSGGGAYIHHGLVQNSLFVDNVSIGDHFAVGGGGLSIEGEGVVRNNTFIRNSGVRGGGLFIMSFLGATTSTVSNNIFIDNEAANGAAIILGIADEEYSNGIVDVTHNTIVHRAQHSGFGISVAGSTATIRNNIITGYERGIVTGDFGKGTSDANLFFGTIQTHQGMSAGQLDVVADPLFVDAANGDFHLQATSPAIDSGLSVSVTEDYDHNPRPQGKGFDRGAFEHTPLNELPVAVAESYSTTSGTQLTVAAPGVLANDELHRESPVEVEVAVGVAHGMLILHADGSFVYLPDAGFVGEDTFAYRIRAGEVTSEVAVVTLVVIKEAPDDEPDDTPDDPNDGDPNDGDPNNGDPNDEDPNNPPGVSHHIFLPQVTR